MALRRAASSSFQRLVAFADKQAAHLLKQQLHPSNTSLPSSFPSLSSSSSSSYGFSSSSITASTARALFPPPPPPFSTIYYRKLLGGLRNVKLPTPSSSSSSLHNYYKLSLKRYYKNYFSSVDWILGRGRGFGYNARIAIINALYTLQPHWARALSLLAVEALTRRGDGMAWCYTQPATKREEELAEQAELMAAEERRRKNGVLWTLARWLSAVGRLLWLLALFSPVALAAVLLSAAAPLVYGRRRRGEGGEGGREESLNRAWLRLLRRTLEIAGPAFIKWGQWAATRHDIFPPNFCKEMELLHSQAPAHSLSHTERAIADAFGFGVTDLFQSFDDIPVASGSIGQIHKAVLSDTGARLTGLHPGRVVAVKVRHPGVSESIERDFGLMLTVAQIAAHLPAMKDLRLAETLEQFAAPLREQVDLAREALHLHAFNFNFRKTKRVSFPVPLYPLVAPAVLVESFETGNHISSYVSAAIASSTNNKSHSNSTASSGDSHRTKISPPKQQYKQSLEDLGEERLYSQLAQLGARTMLHMMILDNLIHADLHPGNILVRLDYLGGEKVKKALYLCQSLIDNLVSAVGIENNPIQLPLNMLQIPRMVLLDAGMATRLSPSDQVNMVGLFESFARLDGRCLADWVLKFAGEAQTCPDPEGFKSRVETTFNQLKSQDVFTTEDTSSGAEALAKVLDIVREYQVTLPGHIASTVVTTLVLEGWSHDLDPKHSTLQEIKRMVAAKEGGFLGWKAWFETAAEMEVIDSTPSFIINDPALG